MARVLKRTLLPVALNFALVVERDAIMVPKPLRLHMAADPPDSHAILPFARV